MVADLAQFGLVLVVSKDRIGARDLHNSQEITFQSSKVALEKVEVAADDVFEGRCRHSQDPCSDQDSKGAPMWTLSQDILSI